MAEPLQATPLTMQQLKVLRRLSLDDLRALVQGVRALDRAAQQLREPDG